MTAATATRGAYGHPAYQRHDCCDYWYTREGRRLLAIMRKADRMGHESLTRADVRAIVNGPQIHDTEDLNDA